MIEPYRLRVTAGAGRRGALHVLYEIDDANRLALIEAEELLLFHWGLRAGRWSADWSAR